MLTAEDRLAIILGRAIIRAEALQAENEQLRARLAEHENGVEQDEEADVADVAVEDDRASP